jgi:hypothetical protein
MSVIVDGLCIRLEGRCLVDDAEPLLLALQDSPGATVEVGAADRLHLAVVQILLAAQPKLVGTLRDSTAARYLSAC